MLKQIINDFGDFGIWLSKYIFYKRHSVKLHLAVKLADIKQKALNRQCFVILNSNNKLAVVNTKDIRFLKQKKLLDKRCGSLELKQNCFYFTSPAKNNSMTPEERADGKKRYLAYARKYF